ncbi:uncharacterized protein LOC109875214 isoform X1 [Oncorhynchus kisutch]|uniref:uncharacterized protein LOC109875214 isoform X1 n=1 Tax=Oncorhynchus kisutch TaxID=8019 RepID=UPI0009A04C9B|nr:uncharacterized protein LOC109875214 isoform X1 [Oncorhynchus kisutch]
MASRYLETILLLCCIVTMFSSTSAAYGPRKLYCCVEFQEKPVPYTQIIGYKQQSYKELLYHEEQEGMRQHQGRVGEDGSGSSQLQTEEDIHSNTVMAKTPQPTLKGRFTHSDTTFSNRNSNSTITFNITSNNPIE